jgi:hypothetical protein
MPAQPDLKLRVPLIAAIFLAMRVHHAPPNAKDVHSVERKTEIRKKPSELAGPHKDLLLLKAAVISCIIVAASLVGYASYEVVRDYEYTQFEQAYNALMDQLIPSTHTGKFFFRADAVKRNHFNQASLHTSQQF